MPVAVRLFGGEAMRGWRIWVLVSVALGVAVWATLGLIFPDDEAGSLAARMLGKADGEANAHAEQIRQESRSAMRDVLLDAEEKEDESR